MKYDVRRSCGCYERVKVYESHNDLKKSQANLARVLARESFKTCRDNRCKRVKV